MSRLGDYAHRHKMSDRHYQCKETTEAHLCKPVHVSTRGPFRWLTNTAVVVAGQLVTYAALAVVGTLCVHTSVHAVVGQGALISVCRDTHTQRYGQWDKSKWALPAKRQNGTAETVSLTFTAVSTPLVAHGALAGVGTFGVVARLFGTASVSASGTFIYVCRKKHTHTNTKESPRWGCAQEEFPIQERIAGENN